MASEIHLEWIRCFPEVAHEELHPCFINSVAHLITEKSLKQRFPAAFAGLSNIAAKYGVSVLQDRRHQSVAVTRDKRKRFIFTVGLLLGITLRQSAFAFDDNSIEDINLDQQVAVITKSEATLSQAEPLNLKTNLSVSKHSNGRIVIGKHDAKLNPQEQQHYSEIMQCFTNINSAKTACKLPDKKDVDKIFKSLTAHSKQLNRFQQQELNHIAYYYAQYPEVIRLIDSLESLNWSLHIKPHTWQAKAFIKHDRVETVEVYFDPSTAAHMLAAKNCFNNPKCAVSAADALLHELLHAQLMLQNPRQYAQQNANALYPVQHEHDVIHLENQLYSAMSERDGLPRPNRHKHQATLVAAACAVCL